MEIIILIVLLLIAAETTYLVYKQSSNGNIRGSVSVFIDTSVLMDGRIVQVAETGFLPGRIVIPRSVVAELQLLADNGDSEKRERARRGLDVIQTLRAIDGVELELLQDGKAEEGVDERLLALAKKYHGLLCTIDFNLNKVAQVEGVRVLNVNELAQQLRMTYLPGDKLRLALTQPGSDSHQAVGHLPDGTMVVVEQAKAQIGKTVQIEVIRSLQTHAGRMMFARVIAAPEQSKSDKPTVPALTKKRRAPQVKRTADAPRTPKTQPAEAEKSTPAVTSQRRQTPQKPKSDTAQSASPRRPKHRTAKQSEAALVALANE